MTATIEEVKRSVASQCLNGFIRYVYPEYQMGWVHEQICSEFDRFLSDVEKKQSPRLMLTLPPRHGKSQIASRLFPAYVFGRDPAMSLIATSYSADLSSRMNRDVQRIIDSEAYSLVFPRTKLRSIAGGAAGGSCLRNSELFEIVGHNGVYRSAGVGGGITGMGANIAIIDDAIKDHAAADSVTSRQAIWDWYTSTLYTRLAPGGGIIVIGTRWHTDDLQGRLLTAQAAGEGDEWRVLNFPAIAEVDEPHRKAGEPLHPERYPLEQLLKIKQAIGQRDWEALYQQHPVPDGGAIFKETWIKYWTRLPNNFDQMITSWDMTFKDSDTSDFVVGQVWGRKGVDLYLIDQYRGRWGFVETVANFKELSKRYPGALRKLVEDKANGSAVIDFLKHEIGGVIPVAPYGSKTARAYAVTTLFESGNVYIPSPELYKWVTDYKTELLQFPSGAHDDQVDATTQAIRDLSKNKPFMASEKLKKYIVRKNANSRFIKI